MSGKHQQGIYMERDGCGKQIKKFYLVNSNERVKPDHKTDRTSKIIFECEGNALLMQMFLEKHLGYRLRRLQRDWNKDNGLIQSKLTYKIIEDATEEVKLTE